MADGILLSKIGLASIVKLRHGTASSDMIQ
jgi:hypothetical protein